jgi:hypothetical protein
MKTYLLTFLLLSISVLCSCKFLFPDDDCDYVFCDSGPFYSDLVIKVSLNSENPTGIIEVFEGNVEDGNLLFSDTLMSEQKSYNFETDMYYSAKAYYKEGKNTIVAINGKWLRAPQDECDCEYDGGSTSLNLRLAQ